MSKSLKEVNKLFLRILGNSLQAKRVGQQPNSSRDHKSWQNGKRCHWREVGAGQEEDCSRPERSFKGVGFDGEWDGRPAVQGWLYHLTNSDTAWGRDSLYVGGKTKNRKPGWDATTRISGRPDVGLGIGRSGLWIYLESQNNRIPEASDMQSTRKESRMTQRDWGLRLLLQIITLESA